MKQVILAISFLFFIGNASFAQTIKKINPDAESKVGQKIPRTKETTLDVPEPVEQKEEDSENDTLPQKNFAVALGVFHGGGGLVGVDFEARLFDKFTVQAGAGLGTLGAGINYHFKDRINSSYISLMMWNQGFGENKYATVVGPTIVFRTKKVFTAMIGYGNIVDRGPAFPEKFDGLSGYLMYSIGVYFPL